MHARACTHMHTPTTYYYDHFFKDILNQKEEQAQNK